MAERFRVSWLPAALRPMQALCRGSCCAPRQERLREAWAVLPSSAALRLTVVLQTRRDVRMRRKSGRRSRSRTQPPIRFILPSNSESRRSAKAAPQAAGSDAQLAHFLVVVLAVQDVPLLGALEDNLALRSDLLAGGGVDACFLVEKILERFARFLADGVAVFEETNLVDLGQRV